MNKSKNTSGIVALLILSIVVFFSGCTVNLINIDPFGPMKPKKAEKTSIAKDSVLHFKLSGSIGAYTPEESSGFAALFGSKSDTIHDLIKKINYAKDDARIRAIIIETKDIGASLSSLNELHVAFNDFKSSGKKIYGYFDSASDNDIFLLSVADEIYMNPSASADIVLMGVGTSMTFLKGLFDKLGVEFHIIRAGAYKGAGETYSRTEMSDELRENYTQLFSDRYERLVADLARGYDITPEKTRQLFENRQLWSIKQNDSITSGLVDQLSSWDDMCEKLSITKKQLVAHNKYTPITPKKLQDKRIAVVYMTGSITESSGGFFNFRRVYTISPSQYNKIFEKIMEDDAIAAVVLRISSGGGSALVSDILYHKIAQLQQKKKVIVSMGSAAASGGYYIATGADYIFADPYTITGSIGVFGGIMNLHGTAEKLGVNSQSLGYGRHDMVSMLRPFDPDLETALQSTVNDVYDEFKQRVATGRNMSLDQVEKIAQGQVWSAQKALSFKLIDEIGLLGNAIEKAAQLSSVDKYSLVYYPKEDDASIFDGFAIGISQPNISELLPYPLNIKSQEHLQVLKEMENDPIQMRAELMIKD